MLSVAVHQTSQFTSIVREKKEMLELEKEFENYLHRRFGKSTVSTTMSDARGANKRIDEGLYKYFAENNFFPKNKRPPLPDVLWDKTNKSADSHRSAAYRYCEFLRERDGFDVADIDDDQDNLVSTFDTERFSIEADLQSSLRQNLNQLEPDLTIADNGSERTVATGRMDILARDSAGVNWVIELKAGTANEQAIGQLMAYMNALAEEEQIDIGDIRGMLIAHDFNDKARHSARMIPAIKLKRYGITFSFDDVT